jgi:hypothetical protein
MGQNRNSGTKSSAAFTPAASAHGARDVVGGAKEFTFVGNDPGESRIINSVELMIAGATAVTTTWEVHLYTVTPPSAIADDAVFDIASGDRTSYLGFVAIAQGVDYGATQYGRSLLIGQQVKLRGTSLFAYLVNVSAITTEAVAHTVTLHSSAAF